MGESACYSWLRHVKGCQIVQTNWKASSRWDLKNRDGLERIKETTKTFFSQKYGYEIYKQSSNLSQILQQTESDVVGISFEDGERRIYTVDVAFHEGGLNYGDKDTTVIKIIAKCIRTAMCIYGFFDTTDAEIIFCSPKINHSVLSGVEPCIADLQQLTDDMGLQFVFHVIANDEFQQQVLGPLLQVSGSVADTNELFLRSYQLTKMLDSMAPHKAGTASEKKEIVRTGIGEFAYEVIRTALRNGCVSKQEFSLLQTKEYSKEALGLDYAAFVREDSDFIRKRYAVSQPISVSGSVYYICSQWMERNSKNHRPHIEKWAESHNRKLPEGNYVMVDFV